VLHRAVESDEACLILNECHEGVCGGHFDGDATAKKILMAGYYWPTLFKTKIPQISVKLMVKEAFHTQSYIPFYPQKRSKSRVWILWVLYQKPLREINTLLWQLTTLQNGQKLGPQKGTQK